MSKKISFINEIIEKGTVEKLRVNDDSTYYKAIRRWKEIPDFDKRRVALEVIKYAKENKLILRHPEILAYDNNNNSNDNNVEVGDKQIGGDKSKKQVKPILDKEKQKEIENKISDRLEDEKVLNKILPKEFENINNIEELDRLNINDKVNQIEEKLVKKNPNIFKNIAKVLKDKIFHKVSEKDSNIKYCLQNKENKNEKIYLSYNIKENKTKVLLNSDGKVIEKQYNNITPEQFIKTNSLLNTYNALEKDNNKFIELPEEITKININKDKEYIQNPEEQFQEAKTKIDELKSKIKDLDVAFKQGESEEEAYKRGKLKTYNKYSYLKQLKEEYIKLYEAQIQYFTNKNDKENINKVEDIKLKFINKYDNMLSKTENELDKEEINELSFYDFQYNRLKGLSRERLNKEALSGGKLKTKELEKYNALTNDEVISKYFPDYVQGSKDYKERVKLRKEGK